MNASLEFPGRDKELLLERSALCRRQLRREARDLRESLRWKRVAVAAVTTPATLQVALGLVVSVIGLGRAARWVMLAGRIVVFAKLARSAIGYANALLKPAACAIEQTNPMDVRTLGSSPRSSP